MKKKAICWSYTHIHKYLKYIRDKMIINGIFCKCFLSLIESLYLILMVTII